MLPRPHFQTNKSPKRLAVGLRPETLGSLGAPLDPQPQWVPWKGTLSSAVRGLCDEEEGWNSEHHKSSIPKDKLHYFLSIIVNLLICYLYFTSFSSNKLLKIIIARHLRFCLKCTEIRLAAGLRPDPLGELKRSPRPPAAVGAMEGNTL